MELLIWCGKERLMSWKLCSGQSPWARSAAQQFCQINENKHKKNVCAVQNNPSQWCQRQIHNKLQGIIISDILSSNQRASHSWGATGCTRVCSYTSHLHGDRESTLEWMSPSPLEREGTLKSCGHIRVVAPFVFYCGSIFPPFCLTSIILPGAVAVARFMLFSSRLGWNEIIMTEQMSPLWLTISLTIRCDETKSTHRTTTLAFASTFGGNSRHIQALWATFLCVCACGCSQRLLFGN